MGTDKRICLSRPSHGSLHGITEVHLTQPLVLFLCELAICDLYDQLVRPLRSDRKRLPTHSTDPFLCDRAVPDVVEVEIPSIPLHIYSVAATLYILVMQRLVQIFDKVQNKLGSLHAPPRRKLGVKGLSRVVGEGGHDAAVILAITLEVDVAGLGGVVVSVDKVEVLGEATPFCVTNRIGPGSNLGEIVVVVVSEQLLEVSLSCVLDKVACDKCSCDVAKTWVALVSGVLLYKRAKTSLTAPSCDPGGEQQTSRCDVE